jgi:hypothetical protein
VLAKVIIFDCSIENPIRKVVGRERKVQGQDALATADRMPVLLGIATALL